MRGVVDEIVAAVGRSHGGRSAIRSRLRRDARALLADHRRARRAIAHRMRRALQQHRRALLASVRGRLGPGTADGGVTTGGTGRVPEEVWTASPVGVWNLYADAVPDEQWGLAGHRLGHEILGAINRHPEGVTASDIGNEIGIDWRRVLGTTAELADRGLIERVGRQFYPGKASRKW
jgi:hypothetical protein